MLRAHRRHRRARPPVATMGASRRVAATRRSSPQEENGRGLMKREDSPSSILTLPNDALFEPRAPSRPPRPRRRDDAELVVGQIDPLIDQVDNLHAFARTGLVGNTVGAVRDRRAVRARGAAADDGRVGDPVRRRAGAARGAHRHLPAALARLVGAAAQLAQPLPHRRAGHRRDVGHVGVAVLSVRRQPGAHRAAADRLQLLHLRGAGAGHAVRRVRRASSRSPSCR